ncbi:MAG: ankyrin repeat domain-containing protein [Parvularculales bacterium]
MGLWVVGLLSLPLTWAVTWSPLPAYGQSKPILSDRPYIEAVRSGDLEAYEEQVVRGVSVNARGHDRITALIVAAELGHTDIVKFILDKEGRVDSSSRDKRTALTMAALGGHDDIITLLLEAGADPDKRGYQSEHALLLAVRNGHGAAVEALLVGGANPNVTDVTGRTALRLAEQARHMDVAKILQSAKRQSTEN